MEKETLVALRSLARIALPGGGSFDHGDVHLASGRVVLAHTATGKIEVLDGPAGRHIASLPGCPEASGVVCDQRRGLAVVASRAGGQLLIVDPVAPSVQGIVSVGRAPNGLAVDPARGRVLAADVVSRQAYLVDLAGTEVVAASPLPGRPRWVCYDAGADRYLLNVQDPPAVILLAAGDLSPAGSWPVGARGPHGLDLDQEEVAAFVACDEGLLLVLDLASGAERCRIALSGGPDVVWYNPAVEELYVAVGDPGAIEILDTTVAAVRQRIATEPGAHSFAFDSERQRLYLPRPSTGEVEVLSVVGAGSEAPGGEKG